MLGFQFWFSCMTLIILVTFVQSISLSIKCVIVYFYRLNKNGGAKR